MRKQGRACWIRSRGFALEMEMQKQMAMQLLSGFGRRGRECGCDGSGKEGKAEKKEEEELKQMTGN